MPLVDQIIIFLRMYCIIFNGGVIGAMENWGLITYRDEYLLFDEKKSSAANKQRVVEVIDAVIIIIMDTNGSK